MTAPRVRRCSLLRVQRTAGNHARSPHHVENAGREAEEEKHDHSPGRDSEYPIEHPTERRTDHNAGDEFGREPKTSRDRGRIGGWTLLRTGFGRTIGVDVAKVFAQTLKPRGKRSLIGGRLFAITFFACVAGHAFDTRAAFGRITIIPPPKAARTILIGFMRVKNRPFAVSASKRSQISRLARGRSYVSLRQVWRAGGGGTGGIPSDSFAARSAGWLCTLAPLHRPRPIVYGR